MKLIGYALALCFAAVTRVQARRRRENCVPDRSMQGACEDGLACRRGTGIEGEHYQCLEPLQFGDPCDPSTYGRDCDLGLWCPGDTRRCNNAPRQGEPCSGQGDLAAICGKDLVCKVSGIENTCQPLESGGMFGVDQCGTDTNFGFFFCAGDSKCTVEFGVGWCEDRLQAGQSSRCLDNVDCDMDAQCLSDVCRPLSQEGQNCDRDSDWYVHLRITD